MLEPTGAQDVSSTGEAASEKRNKTRLGEVAWPNCAGLDVQLRSASPFKRHSAQRGELKAELKMSDNAEKNQGQNPGQSGQQSGQQQQKNPQDVSKKDPSQESNKEQGNKQGQQDQGGQRRAS
jgi:hypothetical protein